MNQNKCLVAFAEKSIQDIYIEIKILYEIGALHRHIVKAWRTDTSR